MNLVISIADHEREMAHRWFDWCCELGGTDGHSLWLIPTAGLNIDIIEAKAELAFGGRVTIISDDEGQTSDWQITEPMRSASGPNSAFRQVAWHFYMKKLGPWFWCELDCIPTRKDWLLTLETQYKIAVSMGKKFMGAQVLLESVPEHMSGNAVYPQNVPEEAPTLVMRTNWTPRDQERSFELAFDIAGAAEVIPKAHWTSLIQHKFRYEGFKSRAEFDAIIDPNAVVFHSDKKGTIFPYLRQNLSGGVESRHALVSAAKSADREARAKEKPSGSSAPPAQTIRIDASPEAIEQFAKTHTEAMAPFETTLDKRRAALVKARAARAAKRQLENTPILQQTVSRTFNPIDEIESVIAQNAVIRNGLPAMSPPWENREDTERDVKMLCEALALFAKAPIYKARVRQALREAKIIK